LKAPLALIPEVQQRLAPGQPIYLYGLQLAIIPYYVERPGRELHDAGEVETVLGREKSGMIVFMADEWAKLEPCFGSRLAAHPMRMGGKRLVWTEFPAPKGTETLPGTGGGR
jgi:hypothetical protein